MAKVDPKEVMKETAVGGPIAGAEYAAQQRGVQDLRQRTLSDSASRAGQINAPKQFQDVQNKILTQPLDAYAGAMSRDAAAASSALGAAKSAQAGYLNSTRAVQGLVADQLRKQAQGYEQQAADDIIATQEKQAARAEKERKLAAKEQEMSVRRNAESTIIEMAKRPDVDADTYDNVIPVIRKAKNYAEAVTALEELESGAETDEDGNFITETGDPASYNPSAARSWLMKAFLTPDQLRAFYQVSESHGPDVAHRLLMASTANQYSADEEG